MEIKEKIIGQSILGKEEFIEWVTDKYLKTETDKREKPALREIQRYISEDKIIDAVERVTGKSFKEIKEERGYLRYLVMDLMYRIGGKKGVAIGKIMGLDYSTVSQGRKRLRERQKKDKKLKQIINKIEQVLSRSKI